MRVSATTGPCRESDADTIALAVFEEQELGEGLPPELGELLSSGEARRSFKSLALGHADGRRWLLVGLGARSDLSPERARVAAAAARSRARELSTRALCWELPAGAGEEVAAALVEGTILGDYRFDRFKTASAEAGAASGADEPKHLESLTLSGAEGLDARVARAALVAEAANAARDLQNRPANDLTPTALADHALALGREIDGLSVEVEGREGIVARGMGAFAAVAQGSH